MGIGQTNGRAATAAASAANGTSSRCEAAAAVASDSVCLSFILSLYPTSTPLHLGSCLTSRGLARRARHPASEVVHVVEWWVWMHGWLVVRERGCDVQKSARQTEDRQESLENEKNNHFIYIMSAQGIACFVVSFVFSFFGGKNRLYVDRGNSVPTGVGLILAHQGFHSIFSLRFFSYVRLLCASFSSRSSHKLPLLLLLSLPPPSCTGIGL